MKRLLLSLARALMPCSVSKFLLISLLSLVFFACNSGNEPASASARFKNLPRDFTASPLTYADTTSPEVARMIQRLDSFYRIQVKNGFNGSVLIGIKGKIIYERYYGFANREQGMWLAPNTASQLASTSKTFTGAAVLYLHQRNYLRIDDPVTTYIPEFPYPAVTVRMLLNHRSGLPDYLHWAGKYLKSDRRLITYHDVVDLLARHQPKLAFKSNTRFAYSNTNYVMLAAIIEKVTEMPYAEFMSKYIFQPLGLEHTFVSGGEGTLPQQAARSYRFDWRRDEEMFADGVQGDKGIYSTVRDMYRWDQSFYQNKILDNETLELAYGPCSFEHPGIKNYGLGWRMLCFPSGNKVIYHNGWWHGNNTAFYRFIKENMTFIVLGNKYNSGIYKQAKVLYSIVRNVPPTMGFDEE